MSLNDLQIKDGYAPLDVSILIALGHTHLSSREWQVLMVIFRKTYGWSKPSDLISLSQFVDGTGLTKTHVCNALTSLVSKGIIIKTVTYIGNGKPTRYEFNKHSGEWRSLPKSVTLPFPVTKPLPIGGHTTTRKDTTTKPPISPLTDEPENKTPYAEVVAYLNEKAKTKYRVTPDLRRLAHARFAEGFTLDDFKKVIDNMVQAWGSDEKMVNYLRPATLFSPKFQSYLNQKPTVKSSRGEMDPAAWEGVEGWGT